MAGARIGVIVGLIFGFVVVWQGIAAAGLIILLTLLGTVIGTGIWLCWKILNGEVDIEDIKKLVGTILIPKKDADKD